MRVIISGTHGSGKTTLGRHLSQRFGIVYAPEQARRFLQTKYTIQQIARDFQAFKDFQNDIVTAQWGIDSNLLGNGMPYIVDRSYLDSLAYVDHRCDAYGPMDRETKEWWLRYRAVCIDHQIALMLGRHRTLILFCRAPEIVTADPERLADSNWAHAIDARLDKYLHTEWVNSRATVVSLEGCWEIRQRQAEQAVQAIQKEVS